MQVPWLTQNAVLSTHSAAPGGLLVHAHCYLHRPSLVPFGHRIPVAPHYFLKLKSPDAIRMVRHVFQPTTSIHYAYW